MSETANPATDPPWRARAGAARGDADEVGSARRFLVRVVTAGMAMGALLGLAAWFRPHPYPVLLPMLDDGGRRPGPTIGQARPDADAIRAGQWFSRATDPAGVRSGETVVAVLESPSRIGLRPGSGEAEVFVRPAGDPGRSDGWVPLRDVLESLDRTPARRVLLLLDVNRPMVDPALGRLADDATARVRDDLEAMARSGSGGRLTVLCAAAPGEVSWASEAWGRSPFLAYAEEALDGWADLDPVTGNRDGRVTLDELVLYVGPRVDRWATRCRGARQTIVLLGARDDFPIAPRRRWRGALPGRPAPAEDRPYPDWLREGWALRDRWIAGSALGFAPWALRRLERALLEAEASWRGGADPDRTRSELADARADATRDFEAARSFSAPAPRSLALAEALGEPPDDRAEQALAKLLQERTDPGAGLKPEERASALTRSVAAFREATRVCSDFALARAVVRAAAAGARLSSADATFFDGLLRGRRPDPRHVEARLLRRLADLSRSTGPDAWPGDAARLALEVAVGLEAAQARPRSFAPFRPWIEEAARQRRLGEAALFAPGFAPAEEAGRRLRRALELAEAVAGGQAIVEHARDLRDEALARLPAAQSLVEADRSLDPAWESAVDAAVALDDQLSAIERHATTAAVDEETPIGEVARLAAPIRSRAEDLGRRLGPLRDRAAPSSVAELVARARSAEGDAADWQQVDALLQTPWPSADARASLWAAARDLERRLLEPVLAGEPDDADRPRVVPRGPEGQTEGPPTAVDAGRRAARSIALLRLAGQDPGRLAVIEDRRRGVERAESDWAGLGEALRLAWLEPIPPGPDDLERRDRMARVIPLEFAAVLLGRWASDPVIDRRAREWTALRAWLADAMLYRALDIGGTDFDADAARDYNPPGRAPGVTEARLVADPPSVTLTPAGPSATVLLRLEPGVGVGEVGLRLLAPAADLPRIRPEIAGPGTSPRPGAFRPVPAATIRAGLPVRLERPDEARPLGPTPRGILVQYRVGGWAFTAEVPVALPADPEPFRVVVDDPVDEPPDRLSVRPGVGPTPLVMRVRNPTAAARSVVVELRAGVGVAPLLSPRLTIGPGAEQPLSFGQGPLPQGRLPVLAGPLRFRVLDADLPEVVLGVQEIRAGIRPSPGYVRVEEVRYDPPGARVGAPDRLTVRLRARAIGAGPPCPVALGLAPERIPGFLSAESGLARVELPADGKEMTLLAEGLRFEEGKEGPGQVAIDVDGVPRAQVFDLRFARVGGAASGERRLELGLAIRAPRAVRGGDPMPIVAEVDNAPEDATLELSLGRSDRGPFDPLVTRDLASPRDARLGFVAVGPGGAAHVEASLDDWRIDFPTTGIRGSYEARARLRDAEGRELATASRSVIVDDAPPRWVRLSRLPKQARRGTALEVRATGQVPASGIRRVVFYVGKPGPDGKPPANAPAADGSPLPGPAEAWSARLAMPPDLRGPAEITVEMTSAVGLARTDTGRIELIDTDPVPTGSIRGVVREGGRPQPGLDVALVNAKGETQLQAKTGDDGAFAFAEVPVGPYTVTSFKPTSRRVGRQPVEVKADATAKVDVDLLYQ